MNPQEFVDNLAKESYGMTGQEAWKQGICINCKKPPQSHSDAGYDEYWLTALCEDCFDKVTGKSTTMKTIRLLTGAGEHVGFFAIPDFVMPPEVIVWGDRVFAKPFYDQDESWWIWMECSAVAIPAEGKADAVSQG